ncbi:hypothetical protein LX99_02942 [Mucilaginibacter oryzae]|uniref:DUF4382 domain-containing protein n=1 Tax=Mucilaginibacter oryzae TaxID=468058 RepID=A0A316HQJ2_9SPHI|nr:hypothetical protein [Mucilaginibacter oryzae]PWK77132.1 hypothetical protein LX99_02942 [Mucilaginibacter oryzae]
MKPISLFTKRYYIITLLALVILSCTKNNEPQKAITGSGKITYVATANTSGTKLKTNAVSDSTVKPIAVNWSSATVWVEKIELVAQGSNPLDSIITVGKKLNIFGTDALAGAIQLPAGSYQDVKVTMFCRKSPNSDYAFDFRGTFTNSSGRVDSIMIGSSYPFEANLAVSNIVIGPSDNYKATFNFNLNNTITGFTNWAIQSSARFYIGADNKKTYVIWKGGSADEPFYNEVIQNWQTVASVVITKG